MLVPLYNKVIVELIKGDGDEKTKSGLYIVNRVNPYYRGKVVAVGKGYYQNAQRIEMDIKVGQIAWFLKSSGMGIEFDEASTPTKLLLADTDIYAIEE
jgi:chaperonin GroES